MALRSEASIRSLCRDPSTAPRNSPCKAACLARQSQRSNAAKTKAANGDLPNPIDCDHNLSDADLSDDALARPRRRNETRDATPAAELDPDDRVDQTSADTNSTDEPAWAHHSQLKPEQLTPVLRHYVELKMAHPERVLLYRLGDFFECFFEDAITLSRELELTLTGKDAGKAIGRVPMAGIPHHAAERYCSDLIRLGYSVALCDQLETTPAKGALLKRDITRVLTPGTVLEEGMLSARRNNWLAAVVVEPAKQTPAIPLGTRPSRCEHWRCAGAAAGGQ